MIEVKWIPFLKKKDWSLIFNFSLNESDFTLKRKESIHILKTVPITDLTLAWRIPQIPRVLFLMYEIFLQKLYLGVSVPSINSTSRLTF